MLYRVPLCFVPQPEGGFTVTSSALPELVTEGDTLDEAFANAQDALAAVVELYADEGRSLPAGVQAPPSGELFWSDVLVASP
ncbi:Antitoxin HicB [Pirellulimonas nuda]|uniref:Antitoxin HicB n=1 Tax=Pirellulimonas nuda TaxID=2528009 RepID=A0A518D9A3_9BACT|nr:type II toxin-antitoxin system HicB family antitoxin [Pirellulimonas nuda]QDU88057.1 Antitoxin HicB [Pirellulimonas nuda]